MKAIYTRATAIYAHCLECSGDSRAEVRHCELKDCPLYPFRCRFVRKGLGRVKTPKTDNPTESAPPGDVFDALGHIRANTYPAETATRRRGA